MNVMDTRTTSALLYLDGVHVSFDGFHAINNLSLTLAAGEMRAVIGAFIVNFGKTWLTGALPEVWLFALGAMFIAVTLFLPKGVVGLWSQIRTRGATRKARAPA